MVESEAVMDSSNRQGALEFLLHRLDDQIRMELDLIGQRMNVLSVSQAFLFTAFTTNLLIADLRFQTLREILLWMIPLLGASVCVVVGVALGAAVHVVHNRKCERDIIRDGLRHELTISPLQTDIFHGRKVEILEHVSPRSWPDRLGNYPPIFLAVIIGICWIILLIAVARIKA